MELTNNFDIIDKKSSNKPSVMYDAKANNFRNFNKQEKQK